MPANLGYSIVRHRWVEFQPLSSDELLITRCITFSFLFYLVGALYLVAPTLGWSLALIVLLRWINGEKLSHKNTRWLIVLWCFSALLLLLSLVIAHVDFNLGFLKIVKSAVGWAKGWALLSIFIVLGYTLKLRYQLICRAACIVGLIALLITPILIVAFLLRLPDTLYVSPLSVLGGAGPEYFTVRLYEIDPFNGYPRWRFFAPWAPAVGFVANIYFLCAWFEKNTTWKIIGLLGNAIMVILAGTRMGMIVLLLVPAMTWGLSRISRPWIMVSTACCILIGAVLFDPLSEWFLSVINEIKEARADSTRIRASLNNIALYRWQSEAVWFGHGAVEAGTHAVEFMPIGSHHNWYGLLFVKGLLGFIAFLIPFSLTCLVLTVKAQYQVSSRLALGVCLILSLYSLSENIEALAYMTWPAWILIGLGIRERFADVDTYANNLMSQFRIMSHARLEHPQGVQHGTHA